MRVFWQICVISALVISSVSAIINNYANSPVTSIYRLRHKGTEWRVIVKGGKQNRRVYIVPVDGTTWGDAGKQDMASGTTQDVISTSGQIRQFQGRPQSIGAQTNSLDLTLGQHANQFSEINHVKIEREPSTRRPGEPSKNPLQQYITIRPGFAADTNATADKGIAENHPNSHLSPDLRRLLPIQSSPSTHSVHLFRPQEAPLEYPEPPICDGATKFGIHDRHPPPNPFIQLALSHYGVHGSPFLFYGQRGLYGYSAANDIHNNQPSGGYKVTEEYD